MRKWTRNNQARDYGKSDWCSSSSNMHISSVHPDSICIIQVTYLNKHLSSLLIFVYNCPLHHIYWIRKNITRRLYLFLILQSIIAVFGNRFNAYSWNTAAPVTKISRHAQCEDRACQEMFTLMLTLVGLCKLCVVKLSITATGWVICSFSFEPLVW